jgi:hypothetical protein
VHDPPTAAIGHEHGAVGADRDAGRFEEAAARLPERPNSPRNEPAGSNMMTLRRIASVT